MRLIAKFPSLKALKLIATRVHLAVRMSTGCWNRQCVESALLIVLLFILGDKTIQYSYFIAGHNLHEPSQQPNSACIHVLIVLPMNNCVQLCVSQSPYKKSTWCRSGIRDAKNFLAGLVIRVRARGRCRCHRSMEYLFT